jgi:hypothetical protein
MFSRECRQKDKASRSKFVAAGNVGSLCCVDRLGSFHDDPAAMSMNESRHSSAARERSISISRATTWVDVLQIVSGWGPAVISLDADGSAPCASSLNRKPHLAFSRLDAWSGKSRSPSAVSQMSAMNTPLGASPARFVSNAGGGPVLCFHLQAETPSTLPRSVRERNRGGERFTRLETL